MKLNKKTSYLATCAFQFGRYRFTRQSFGVAPAGDIFQQRIDGIFKYLPNVFSIADDILIVGYDVDSRDPKKTQK